MGFAFHWLSRHVPGKDTLIDDKFEEPVGVRVAPMYTPRPKNSIILIRGKTDR